LRRRIFGIVAEAVFLVAVADLDRVLVPRRADETRLAATVRNQRVQPDRRAVDAEIAIGDDGLGRAPHIIGDQLETVLNRLRWIVRGRERLEQLDAAVCLVGDDKIGEGAAGVDAQTILRGHGWSLSDAAPRR